MKRIAFAAAAIAALSLASPAVAQSGNGRPPPTPRSTPAPSQSGGPVIGQPVKMSPAAILKKPLMTYIYKWQAYSNPVAGPPVDKFLCLLTSVSGKFAGAGERVAVTIDTGATGGPRWVLNGTSGQPELKATMTCVTRDQFVYDDGLFDGFLAKAYGNHTNGGCAQQVVSMGQPDKSNAFFLSSIAGKFAGGGESVSVVSQGGQGAIRVTGCSGYVDGTLVSIGHLSGKPLQYRTPTARLPLGSPGVDFATDSTGPTTHLFAGDDLTGGGPGTISIPVPANEAFCGLTEITGKFQGYGERVEVFRGKEYWGLSAIENGDDAAIHATARCIARDQRSK